MELQIDLSKEYGIVLEGGGAKGAYQIGVWKALKEAGIKIRGIAGVSVGALNGALMCMDDLEKAEKIWKNIEYSHVMDVSDTTIKALKNRDFKALNIPQLLSSGVQFVKDRGFDVAPLKHLIDEVLDEEKISNSDCELFAVTYSVSDRKELAADIKNSTMEERKDMLLASAYFLAFKNEKLNGKRYMDGGGVNNVPINVLIEKGYKNIIVLRIYGLGLDREKEMEIPEDVAVYHVAPRQDLGGILQFEKKNTRKNITLGYFDGLRFLYGLSGRMYYIDARGSEDFYFSQLMAKDFLSEEYRMEFMNKKSGEPLNGYRLYTEQIFPYVAEKLKLKPDWDYKLLYLSLLEYWAKRLKIKRFQLYTEQELLDRVEAIVLG